MAFVIREVGREKEILVESCEIGKEGQEETFKTHQQAERALEQLKGTYPFIQLEIINLRENKA